MIASTPASASTTFDGIVASWRDVRVLVVGLGRFGGGVGVTRWLAGQGARVTVTDQASAESLAESVHSVSDIKVSLELGRHTEIDRARFDLVIVSPAVRRDSEIFRELVAGGAAWTTEINLFLERCPAPIVAVTGSFGKSTTCSMLAHVLQAARGHGRLRHRDTYLGGNIGGSLLNDLHRISAEDVVVLELSNAQLEHTPRIAWTPEVAVITNIHPHHLDRYASFEEYARVKLNVLGAPRMTNRLVLGPAHHDIDSMVRAGTRSMDQIVIPSHSGKLALTVSGSHNQANAGCVIAACGLLDIDEQAAKAALADFRGLPHRLQFVRTVGGVDFINDSKSTAPQATVTALQALCEAKDAGHANRRIVLIVGGQDKPEPLEDMPLEITRNCQAVICMGECAMKYAAAIRAAITQKHVISTPSVETTTSLERALALAIRPAKSGDAVLFSPGAPSFDSYRNFADRGEHFIRLVNGLAAID